MWQLVFQTFSADVLGNDPAFLFDIDHVDHTEVDL